MQDCDTLILPRWCIPVEPDGLILDDYGIAIADGRIVAVLPAVEARERFSPRATIERPNHVLIPGFVNSHTHAAMTLLRGLADDLPLERWLKEAIWPVEGRWVGTEFVRDGTRLAIAEMLLAGCTCFSDQYFFPEIVAATAQDLHMRAQVATPVLEFPTPWANNATEYLSKGVELVHDRFANDTLITTAFAPHSTASVNDDSFIELRVLADQLDKPVQIHLHESAQEVADALDATGERPFARLQRLGLVNSSLLAVHAVHLNDTEIRQFADAGVSVAHCPNSNLKLADGIARVSELLDAGVTVALGTDGAASNNTLNMAGEMRSAALLAKAESDNAAAVPAAAALRMATLSGAEALGLSADIGSIEIDKWADITCIDLSGLNTQPVYAPASQIVYAMHPHQVADVWVAGRQQVENSQLLHIDTNDILRRSNEWQQRIGQNRTQVSQ